MEKEERKDAPVPVTKALMKKLAGAVPLRKGTGRPSTLYVEPVMPQWWDWVIIVLTGLTLVALFVEWYYVLPERVKASAAASGIVAVKFAPLRETTRVVFLSLRWTVFVPKALVSKRGVFSSTNTLFDVRVTLARDPTTDTSSIAATSPGDQVWHKNVGSRP